MAVRARGAGVMAEGGEMAAIINGGGGLPGYDGPLRNRPTTRPPPNLPPAGRPRVPAAAAADALDAFLEPGIRPQRPPQEYNPVRSNWALPTDLRASPPAGGGGAELQGQLAQVLSRLSHLEQENAAMRRTMDLRDAEVRKAAQLDQTVKGVVRQMSEIDETLRRASNAHDGAARRIRALEDAVGYGSDTGGAHAGRLHALEEAMRQVQSECQGLAGELGKAAGERSHSAQKAQAALDEVSAQLDDRLRGVEANLAVQLRAVTEEGRDRNEAISATLQQTSEELHSQLAEVNGDIIPGLERSLREQLMELRRVIESSVTQLAEDSASHRERAERERGSIRSDLKELQGVAQKGLLTLRAESEKQGKTLASIIKEEIATRTLNFETVNKQIEEVRLQLDADMSASANDLAAVRQEMQSQFEMADSATESIREELETVRTSTIDSYLENLRGELLSIVEQRHGTCMETVKGYGLATEQELRHVANRIVKEEMTRAEVRLCVCAVCVLCAVCCVLCALCVCVCVCVCVFAGYARARACVAMRACVRACVFVLVQSYTALLQADSDEMKALEQVKEQVARSVSDWHTAMDKFDAQHLAEQQKRTEAEKAIREELQREVTKLVTKTEENYEAQLVLLEGVRDELHAKVDQTAESIHSTLTLHKKESDRAIDRAVTSAESRADSLDSALERDIASVRGELSGVEEELTKLQDESRQTLIGFREYMETEFEAVAAAREELHSELKGSIESAYQDSKNDCEFAVKDLEDRTRSEMAEEISAARDELGDDMKELSKELSQAIASVKQDIEELGTLRGEMQGMRVRVTANAVSITGLDSKTQKESARLRDEMERQRETSDATLQEVTRLVADTGETMGALSDKIVQFESTLNACSLATDRNEEVLADAVAAQRAAEQSLRVQASKLEERLSKRVTLGDFQELSHQLEHQAAAHQAAALEHAGEVRRIDERLHQFGQLLQMNSEKDEVSEKEMTAKICAVLSPELATLFQRDDEDIGALVSMLEKQRVAEEAKVQAELAKKIEVAEEAVRAVQGTVEAVQTAQAESGATKEELEAVREQLREAKEGLSALQTEIKTLGTDQSARWEKHEQLMEAAAKDAEAKAAEVAAAKQAEDAEAAKQPPPASSQELAAQGARLDALELELKEKQSKEQVETAIEFRVPKDGSGLSPPELGKRLEAVEKELKAHADAPA